VISVIVGLGSLIPRADEYAYLVGGSEELLILLAAAAALVLAIPALYNVWCRTIRFVEVSTSEAMLATRSGEALGYHATSKALRWAIMGLYVTVGFVIISPLLRAVLHENIAYMMAAAAAVSIIVIALWNSVQTVNSKMCEVFQRKEVADYVDSSRELDEISEIISAMERDDR
jgi:hypothetical protein